MKRPPAVFICTLALATILFAGVIATPGSADHVADNETGPPLEPENGLENGSFHTLWSHEPQGRFPNATGNQWKELRNTTDIPFSEPVRNSEVWNRRDLTDYPVGGNETSVYTVGSDLTNETYIKDAHATMFAVQPSTVLLGGPQESDKIHYAAPNGEVAGVTDWRVQVPPRRNVTNDNGSLIKTEWSLERSYVEEARSYGFVPQGNIGRQREYYETVSEPNQTMLLEYGELEERELGPVQVGFEAQINVTLENTTRKNTCLNATDEGICTEYEHDPAGWANWNDTEKSYETETVDVADEVDVNVYDITTSGRAIEYQNGDLGLLIQGIGDDDKIERSFSSILFPNGDRVSTPWEFYNGHNRSWEVLKERHQPTDGDEDSDTQTIASPALPVQLYAYPSRTDPTLGGSPDSATIPAGEILESNGSEYLAPDLPETVDLEPPGGTYNRTQRLAVRHPTTQFENITVNGLVRGIQVQLDSRRFQILEHRSVNLSAKIVDEAGGTTRVKVMLFDKDGNPISTELREGAVYVDGIRVNTPANGTAFVNVTRDTFHTIEYRPARFYKFANDYAYAGANTVVRPGFRVSGVMNGLFILIFMLIAFWSPLYALDQISEDEWWPPWKGIF